MTAPKIDDTTFIRRFIQRGADRNMRDKKNSRPLDIAQKIFKDPKLIDQSRNLLEIREEKCVAMKPLLC